VRNPAAQGRPDANQAEIVGVYESLFCGVIDTHKLGFGFPDILLHYSGWCGPREIKTEDGELNAAQRTFARDWKGPKIKIIRTMQQAIDDVQEVRRRMAGLK
jgi:hypothetical protein